MGKCRFQRRAVAHDRVRQIRQILFPEEGQRDLPHLLRQGNAAHAALYIRRQKCGVILNPGRPEDKYQARQNPDDIERNPASSQFSVHRIENELVQQPNRYHKRYILQHTRQTALDHIDRALSRQCKPFLQFLYHASAPFPSFHEAASLLSFQRCAKIPFFETSSSQLPCSAIWPFSRT